MKKPEKLKKGDTICIVSLSSGMLGEKQFIHKYHLGKERLEEMGFKVIASKHALKGLDYLYNHPEKRCEDLMEAFLNKEVKAIICAIGGEDSIRMLPFINYDIIFENPKIFLGYSDTTISHFIMYKAGIISYYGQALMTQISEYGNIFDYNLKYFKKVLCEENKIINIESSLKWTDEYIPWDEKNMHLQRSLNLVNKGYEVLQGTGIVKGILLGGCIDVFPMFLGTNIFPLKDEWENKILLIETSEQYMEPENLKYLLRNFGIQGILNNIKGIIVGKPQNGKYYEEYKEIYLQVLNEFKLNDLIVLYNVNIGHSEPVCILPIGGIVEINTFDLSLKIINE